MPHVNIKYFPILTKEQEAEMVSAFTKTLTQIIKCDEKVISIALEPIEKAFWAKRVYVPEIIKRKNLLRKFPSYLID